MRRREPILGPIYTMEKGCDHNIVKEFDIDLMAVTWRMCNHIVVVT
jgi:hypothetical protein